MWNSIISGPLRPPRKHPRVAGATLVLGRAPDNDVVLPSDPVSRRHARLVATDNGLRVSDLGSRNGTLLNGHSRGRVSRPFSDADVITPGDFVVRLQGDEDSTAPSCASQSHDAAGMDSGAESWAGLVKAAM
ncbi:hypothetical protein KH5H1_60820 [Corallococcus caeni]|uniref:FHA domain-containing protein n=1 Tax=Corallococcus caeni TaxID=3082388 RepID=UPI002956350B|nr:hypothetical protein KH5H1_60820 [Corallococcus sp. KH5-1]